MSLSHYAHKIITAIFLVVILIVSYLSYCVYLQGVKVDLDLKSLLPSDVTEPLTNKVDQRIIDVLGDQLVIAVDAVDLNEALRAAAGLEKVLPGSSHFSLHDINSSLELLNQQQSFLQSYRYHLLTSEQKQYLVQSPQDLLEFAQAEIFGLSGARSDLSLSEDPLRLFGSFWQQQIPNSVANLREGRLVFSSDKRHTVVQLLKLDAKSTSISVQEDVALWTRNLQTQFKQEFPDVNLYFSGAIFHSAFATELAKKEVSIIGFGSIVGIMLLFLLAFRRIHVLIQGIVSVGFGCFSAFILVSFLFQEIHLIALIFGASLIGVAIDYSLHYVSKRQVLTDCKGQYDQVLRRLILPMLLGLSTTLLSYSCLLQSDLKVLNQIAVFSIMGLLTSWLYVCVVYPVVFYKNLPPQSSLILNISNAPSRFWQKKYYAITAVVVLLTIIVVGLAAFKLSNEVRTLYKPPGHLLESEQYLQKKLNNISLHQYLLLRAVDEESLLQLEENVRQSLDQLVVKGDVGSYLALSQQVPSIKTQMANRNLLQEKIYQSGGLLDQLTLSLELGNEFSAEAKSVFENTHDFLRIKEWLTYARPDQRILWLEAEGEAVSIIVFKSIHNIGALRSVANGQSVFFVDKVEAISHSIYQLMLQAIQWLLVSYAIIGCFLIIYFRSPIILVLPLIPFCASVLAVSVLSLWAVPINLFHVFGCYLILGLGIDYAIFHFFDYEKDSATQYGTFLSALTSIMSFGFLAFSSTPMVQSFGMMLLLGCSFSLLLAPLTKYVSRQRKI